LLSALVILSEAKNLVVPGALIFKNQFHKTKKGRWIMFRKELALVAIVLAVGICDLQAAQIASTWDGGGDGQFWRDADNWDPNIVPDNDANTFAVTIDSNSMGANKVQVHLQTRTVDQLDCYGEVELRSYTSGWVELILVNPAGLTNYGYLVIEELEIGGNVTNTTGATVELEDMGIEGDLYNPAGATIEVFYEVWVDAVENAGSIMIALAGKLDVEEGALHNTGQINIYGGACTAYGNILDNNDTGLIKGFGVLYVDQLLRNKGQIYAYGGCLAIDTDGPLVNEGILSNYPLSSLHMKPAVDVNNQGTIEVNAGGGVAFDCNLVNEPNGIIELLGGTLAATTITQKADANFAGFGGISGDVVIDPNGLIQITGPTNVVGDVTISPNATLEVSDGLTLITGHTTCNGTIRMLGGYIIPQGGLSGSCNVIWEPGLYTNVADFNLDGHVNLEDFALFADTWLWQSNWH